MNVLIISPRNVIRNTTKNGIGTYVDGLRAMFSRMGIHCDVIAEDPPKADPFLKYHGSEFIAPEVYDNLSQKILDQVFSKHYEMIVSSTFEGIMCLVTLELHRIIPTFYRTHSSPFSYVDTQDMQLRMRLLQGIIRSEFPYIKLFTQAPRVSKLLEPRMPGVPIYHACNYVNNLGLPPSDHKAKTSGVMYIARYQDLKNVEHFAETMARLKVPVKIMTSSPTSATRWKKLLDSHGLDHDVRYGLSGQEKADFIASARIAVQWSKSEVQSNSVVECMAYCPTLVLHTEYGWHKDYSGFPFYDKLFHAKPEKVLKVLKRMYRMSTRDYRESVADLPEQHRKQAMREWGAVLRDSSKYIDLGRVGKSELSSRLDSGKVVDFSEFASDRMYRKLRQLYCYHNQIGLKTKGPKIKSRSPRNGDK